MMGFAVCLLKNQAAIVHSWANVLKQAVPAFILQKKGKKPGNWHSPAKRFTFTKPKSFENEKNYRSHLPSFYFKSNCQFLYEYW